jgi:MFS family permease
MQIVKKKSESQWRWVILILTCTMMIGNYYCYDIPAALNSQMDDYFGKPDDYATLFSLLYTVYSIPNVILPFFGGYFVDKLGVRMCLIIFALLITLGQFIFAIGLSAKSWPIMFLGRVVYGFGGENLGVANSAVLSIWFEGKELALAFGLNLSIARLGSVINNLVSPILANGINIQFALWFGVILCGGSVASCILISSIDKHLDSVMGGKGAHSLLINPTDDDETDKEIEEKNKQLRKTLMQEAEGHAEVLQARHSIERSPSFSSPLQDKEGSNEPEISFKDVFTFKQIFWVLAVICVVVYG